MKYDKLPQYVKNIIDTFDDNEDTYKECRRIIENLNNIGWDANYGLNGILFNINPINKKEHYDT